MPRARNKAAFACARCYRRKKKCDNILPTCSRCKQAGVDCVSLDRDTDGEIPRSVVQFLESSIASLEIQLGLIDPCNENFYTISDLSQTLLPRSFANINPTTTGSLDQTDDLKCHGQRPQSVYISVNRLAANALERISTSLPEGLDRITYGKAWAGSSELPVSLNPSGEQPRYDHARLQDTARTIGGLREVPRHVATALVDIYIDRILPQYPYFLEDDLRTQFDMVYKTTDKEPSEDAYFIVSMLMAFSTLTSKEQNVRKLCAVAEALHRDALNHSSFLRHTTIRSLQCIILLEQFGALLPHTANLWNLVGEGMNMAIALGLHQEPDATLGLDHVSLDLRRRIFWSIYALERSLAVTSHRPFTIRDEHIGVQLPSDSEDAYIRPSGIEPGGRRLKFHFLNFIRFRQIQSEICAVQFFNQSVTRDTYAEWTTLMERKIADLQQSILSMVDSAPDWCSHSVCQSQLMLYRPCSHNPAPSEEQRLACFAAAVDVVNVCFNGSRNAYLKFVFHMVHNLFEAGTTILYLLKQSPEKFRALYGNSHIVDILSRASSIFTIVSERWPAALDVGELFDGLKRATMKLYMVSDDTNLPANDLQLLNQLDDIVLRKAVEDLYQRDRQSAIDGDRGSPPVGRCDNWSSLFRTSTDDPVMVGDFWQEINSIGFDECNLDFIPLTMAPASPFQLHEVGQGNIIVASSGDSGLEQGLTNTLAGTTSTSKDSLNEKLKNSIKLLPACNECRRRRVRCDRQLPTCHNCTKAQDRCVYYDHVLSEDVPREYVHALQSKLQDLLGEQDRRVKLTSSSSLTGAETSYDAVHPAPAHPELPSMEDTSNCRQTDSFTIACSNSGLLSTPTIFLGPTSAFSFLLKAGRTCNTIATHHFSNNFAQGLSTAHLFNQLGSIQINVPADALALSLLQVFSASINVFCPVFTRNRLHEIYTYLDRNSPSLEVDCWQHPTSYLIFAISLHLMGKKDHRLTALSLTYFKAAIGEWQSLKELRHIPTIRIRLLVCIYVVLNPVAGDIWRLVGSLSRMFISMYSSNRSHDTEEEKQENSMLYRTTFCLECEIAIAFGRPTRLPVVNGDISHDWPTITLDKVSYYLYEFSGLRSFIHARLLAFSSYGACQAEDNTYNLNTCAWHINSRSKLDDLRTAWSNETFGAYHADVEVQHSQPRDCTSPLDSNGSSDNNMAHGTNPQTGTPTLLSAWGESLYQQSILLLEHAISVSAPHCGGSLCTSASGSELAHSAAQFVRCYSIMHEGQLQQTRRALTHPALSTSDDLSGAEHQDRDNAWQACFYPVSTWIAQHALFSAGLTMLSSSLPIHPSAPDPILQQPASLPHDLSSFTLEDRVRQCMGLIRTLEADQDTLSNGLSNTLEGFYMSCKKL